MKKLISASVVSCGLVLLGCGSDEIINFANNQAPLPAPTNSPEDVGKVAGDKFPTIFYQTLPSLSGNYVPSFPTSAHVWDVRGDFAIVDGGGDSFDGALTLRVQVSSGAMTSYPGNLSYPELSYFRPVLGQSDGLISVARGGAAYDVPLQGSQSAYLACGNLTALAQQIDLTGRSAPVAVSWQQRPLGVSTGVIGGPNGTFRVVARDLNGNLLQTFQSGGPGTGAQAFSVNADSLAGQRFVLSFEAEGFSGTDTSFGRKSYAAAVDNVTVTASGSGNLVASHDFETDLSGWTTAAGNTSQFVRSGKRTIDGIEVQRSWFALPGQRWARNFDTYRNTTGAALSVTVEYQTNLGSDSRSQILAVAGSNNRAWTNVENDAKGDDDTGLVHGSLPYTLPNGPVNLDVAVGNLTFTLQPNETRSVCQFLLMDNAASGIGNPAANLNPLALQILSNFTSFLQGLSSEERATILNF